MKTKIKIVISLLFLLVIFVNLQSQGNSCLQDWDQTKIKIDRLRKIGECPQFPNIEDCKINSGYLSEVTKIGLGVGAVIGSKMSYVAMKCAGASMAHSEESENIYGSLFLNFANAQTGGCLRAYETFLKEMVWATNQATRAGDQAIKTKTIELWARQSGINPIELKNMLAKYTKETGWFGAFEGKKQTLFHHMRTIEPVLDATNLVNAEKDVVKRKQAEELLNILRGSTPNSVAQAPELKALRSAKEEVVKLAKDVSIRASNPQNFTSAWGAAKSVVPGMDKLSKALETMARIVPQDIATAHATSLTKGLYQSFEHGKVCNQSKPATFVEFVADQMFSSAYAQHVCSVSRLAKAATVQGEKTVGRLILGRAMLGLNVATTILTAYEIGSLTYNAANPCPTSDSKYLVNGKRSLSDSCQPSMSIESLMQPNAFFRKQEEEKYKDVVKLSFFDLTEEQQKQEFGNSQFCDQFDNVFNERLASKTAMCDGSKMIVQDAKAGVSYRVEMDDSQKISQVTAFGN
jgi:hypothetical protein